MLDKLINVKLKVDLLQLHIAFLQIAVTMIIVTVSYHAILPITAPVA